MSKTIKALTFDVFGTVVDWRNSIIQEGAKLDAYLPESIDWPAFADAWRAGYEPAMDRVRKGDLPWVNIDALHSLILDELLEKFQITSLTADQISHFNKAWHRLVPWPDVREGLGQLRKHFVVATLSNGNVALLTNLSKNADLRWDCILSSELAGHYKPDAEVYLKAAQLLSLAPEEVMMVAAHNRDLEAASAVGFKTAFVYRTNEYGPSQTSDLEPSQAFDYVATDLIDLARQMS